MTGNIRTLPPHLREKVLAYKAQHKKQAVSQTFIQLGAYGDIISALPVLHWEKEEGVRPMLIVARQFADILEGVSYVEPIIFDGHYSELPKAEKAFEQLRPRSMQVYGYPHYKTSESFQRDAWARVGYDHRWEQLGLVFDRRSPEREQALIDQYATPGVPLILVCTAGASSVFPHAEKLWEALSANGLMGVRHLDIGTIKAERIYDLLGLIDRAQLFICNDTALLHLAQATSTPVIALVNDADLGWLGSLRRANHVHYTNFLDFDAEKVAQLVRGLKPYDRQLLHVVSHYPVSDDDRHRRWVASNSWWGHTCFVPEDYLPRTAANIGDKPLPYIRDLIEAGLMHSDAVVLTNADTGLVPEAEERIRLLLGAKQACYGYRFEHANIEKPLTYHENIRGTWRGGVELIAVTRQWWDRWKHLVPDLVLGRQFWDIVMRDLIKQTGGGELYGCVFHEFHESDWKKQDYPGNRHNADIFNRWMKKHDSTRPFSGLYLLEQ